MEQKEKLPWFIDPKFDCDGCKETLGYGPHKKCKNCKRNFFAIKAIKDRYEKETKEN